MTVETVELIINDILIRSVIITIREDFAIVEYFINVPKVPPAIGYAPQIFGGINKDFVGIDIANGDGHIVFKVDPATATATLYKLSAIAEKIERTVSD